MKLGRYGSTSCTGTISMHKCSYVNDKCYLSFILHWGSTGISFVCPSSSPCLPPAFQFSFAAHMGLTSICNSRSETVSLCQNKQKLPEPFVSFIGLSQLVGCKLGAPGFTITLWRELLEKDGTEERKWILGMEGKIRGDVIW